MRTDRFTWHRQVFDGSQQQKRAMLMEIGSREIRPALMATYESIEGNRMPESIRNGISRVVLVGAVAT